MANTHNDSHAQTEPATTISNEEALEAHVRFYWGFLTFAKWAIGIIFVILIFLYFTVQPHIQPPPT